MNRTALRLGLAHTLLLGLLTTAAQTGTVVEATFSSEILGRYSSRGGEVRYTVYLPPGYAEAGPAFPVVYLLHGSGGSETDWLVHGAAAETMDALIAAGEVPPSILVMPSDYLARYTPGFVRPGALVEVFARELVTHIDAAYPTLPGPEFRAVAGVSFGGYMAVYLALSRPEVFGWGASLGGPFWTTELSERFGRTSLVSFFFGKPEAAAEYSVYGYLDGEAAPGGVFLSVSDDDAYLGDNVALYRALKAAGIDAQLRVTDGFHGWHAWRRSAPEVLRFFGDKFRP